MGNVRQMIQQYIVHHINVQDFIYLVKDHMI
jgi:hypothetical protein